MNARTEPIAVEIYGQVYHVRGEDDPAYLMELARFVDARMREVSSKVSTVEPMKIAILAALNIADELIRDRRLHDKSVGAWMEKTEELVERLGRSLAEPPKMTTV